MGMYVIQVMGGTETRVRDYIRKLMGSCVTECYVPRREIFRREKGQWQTVRETLFPGYLFVRTDDIQQVSARLASVPAFTRLLGKSDERVIPLSQDEVAWLTALMCAVPGCVTSEREPGEGSSGFQARGSSARAGRKRAGTYPEGRQSSPRARC